MKKFKGVWIPYEILTDIKLNDKEKIVYSMIIYLNKERECTITNSYISELLNISKVQSSRIINSLKKKLYIRVEDSDEMLKIIFQSREDELVILDKKDKDFINRDESNKKKKYYYLNNQLNKIPYNLKSIKECILKSLEDYIECINYENAYFNEKYYLNGLKDGIKLMSEIER